MSRRKNMGTAVPRLQQDYLNLHRDPVPYVRAEPLPEDMLEWHYVIDGPENTPYHGGIYYGRLVFTQQYPFKPPSIYMFTPNGRFETNRRLCLSISDYHPDEWNPSWCVSSILTGLLSFMLERTPALGTVETSQTVKVRYARQSAAWNVQQPLFRSLFPELTADIQQTLRTADGQTATAAATAGPNADGAQATQGAAVDADGQPVAGDPALERFGMNTEDWSAFANNAMALLFTGLIGLIGYHVFGIMSAE